MTPAELNQPWRDFDVHLVPWRAVLRRGAHEASLEADELLNACAAFELGRHPQAVARGHHPACSKGDAPPLPWADPSMEHAASKTDRARPASCPGLLPA